MALDLAAKGPDAPEWLTLPQAAAFLQVSKRTMARLVSREAGKDRIPAARFGACVRVRRSVLDKYMEKRTA
jgi:excisionase family DNA binding protein